MSNYNLFLDDERFPKDVKWIELPPVAWIIARNYDQFVQIIERDGIPNIVSFDHDLADEHYQEYHASRNPLLINKNNFRYDQMKEKTGYHCAQWLAQYCVDKKIPLPVYYLHTMNPIGKANMFSVLESARKVIAEQKVECQGCKGPNGSVELQPCPYQQDVNNDNTPCCNCCSECCRQCCEDI